MGTVQIDGSTPKITVGNATAEDATILFDGNAQDFYIALDDSADDLVIGLGSTVGTTPAISINEDRDVTISDGAIDFNIASHDTSNGLKLGGTLVSATAAELNIMDGVTSTTAELNLMDGGTSATSTTIVDADRVPLNDAGTMVQVAMSDVKTYIGAGANAPYFAARRSNTAQTVANDTYVTIVFDTEILDSASTYNTSDGLWTPGTAGRYFVFGQVAFAVAAGTDWDAGTIIIDKNSAGYTDTNNKSSMLETQGNSGSTTLSFYVSQIFDLDADDTVRIQFQGGWAGSSSNATVGYGKTYFGGYKLA